MTDQPRPDVFTAPATALSEEAVRAFVADAIASRIQAESLVLEFKLKNNDKNVVLAVAAMANTDGGLVVVGVDEKSPNDPFVGIRGAEVDSIVQQLRALVPGAMPEVVPIALSDRPDRLILLLRVDADQVDQPVVVDGRVMKRAPGQSVGARRDEIIALATIERGSAAAVGSIPWDPARMRTWSDDADTQEVRILAQLLLPRHVSQRRYLGSSAIDEARDALTSGPIPQLACAQHLRSHEHDDQLWTRETSTALSANFSCAPRRSHVRGVPRFEAMALVRLSGRLLDVLLAVRQVDGEDGNERLSTENLADVLLGATYSAVSTGHSVAASIGAEHPVAAPTVEAWINGPVGPGSFYFDSGWELSRDDLPEYRLPRLRPPETSIEALHATVLEWLTSLVLDLGGVGVEGKLHSMGLPSWAARLASATS